MAIDLRVRCLVTNPRWITSTWAEEFRNVGERVATSLTLRLPGAPHAVEALQVRRPDRSEEQVSVVFSDASDSIEIPLDPGLQPGERVAVEVSVRPDSVRGPIEITFRHRNPEGDDTAPELTLPDTAQTVAEDSIASGAIRSLPDDGLVLWQSFESVVVAAVVDVGDGNDPALMLEVARAVWEHLRGVGAPAFDAADPDGIAVRLQATMNADDALVRRIGRADLDEPDFPGWLASQLTEVLEARGHESDDVVAARLAGRVAMRLTGRDALLSRQGDGSTPATLTEAVTRCVGRCRDKLGSPRPESDAGFEFFLCVSNCVRQELNLPAATTLTLLTEQLQTAAPSMATTTVPSTVDLSLLLRLGACLINCVEGLFGTANLDKDRQNAVADCIATTVNSTGISGAVANERSALRFASELAACLGKRLGLSTTLLLKCVLPCVVEILFPGEGGGGGAALAQTPKGCRIEVALTELSFSDDSDGLFDPRTDRVSVLTRFGLLGSFPGGPFSVDGAFTRRDGRNVVTLRRPIRRVARVSCGEIFDIDVGPTTLSFTYRQPPPVRPPVSPATKLGPFRCANEGTMPRVETRTLSVNPNHPRLPGTVGLEFRIVTRCLG